MGFLKKLFGGGGSRTGDTDGIYFYVRAQRSGEVIPIRLNRNNDLSLTDDLNGYYVRKLVVGQKSFDRIEAEFWFDKNRHFVSADVTGGELVDRSEYEAYKASTETTP